MSGRPADDLGSAMGASHVIFVSLAFWPHTSASSCLFTDLLERLSSQGTRITVLCGFLGTDGFKVQRSEVHHEIRVVRCGLRLGDRQNLFARALVYSSFLVHAVWKVMRLGKSGLVIGATDPPFTNVALWLSSRIARFEYQALLLDIYPDGLVGLGKVAESSVITKLWRWANRMSLRRAKRVVVIGRDMAALVQSTYQLDRSMVTFIPHWAPLSLETSLKSSSSTPMAHPDLIEKFVIQYSGNMGLWHDIDSVVRAAAILHKNSLIHFVFIGRGRRRAAAERLARDLGLTNVTWLDFVAQENLPQTLSACHGAVVSLRRGLEGVAVPSKLYGILASGRAVIAQVPYESEVALVVREEGCGIVVPPGNERMLAEGIAHLAENPEAVQRMGRAARSAYITKYNLEVATSRFAAAWGLT